MWQTPLERLCADGRGEGGKQTVGWWLPALNTADFEANVIKRKPTSSLRSVWHAIRSHSIMRDFAFSHLTRHII